MGSVRIDRAFRVAELMPGLVQFKSLSDWRMLEFSDKILARAARLSDIAPRKTIGKWYSKFYGMSLAEVLLKILHSPLSIAARSAYSASDNLTRKDKRI